MHPGAQDPPLYDRSGAAIASARRRCSSARGLAYDEVALDDDPAFAATRLRPRQQWTVPLVMIDGEPIGGYDELAALDRSGLLAERLAA